MHLNTLDKLVHRGLTLDRCQNCKGIWFDDKELSQVLNSAYQLEDRRIDIADSKENKNIELSCPRCRHSFKTSKSLHYQSQEIDLCTHCGGIWLDSGELSKIKAQSFGLGKKEKYPSTIAKIYANLFYAKNLHEEIFRGPETFIPTSNKIKEHAFKIIFKQKIGSDQDPWFGKISILISGFKNQNIISIDKIQNAIELLPDNHLTGLQCIYYDPERRIENVRYYMIRNFHKRPHTSGMYEHEKYILIYAFKSEKIFYEILYHEIGHYVYLRRIRKNVIHEWVNQMTPHSGHVSKYAENNRSEDFAESYMNYILYPKKLKKASETKFNFMKDKIFQGFKIILPWDDMKTKVNMWLLPLGLLTLSYFHVLVQVFVEHKILKETTGYKRNRNFVFADYLGMF